MTLTNEPHPKLRFLPYMNDNYPDEEGWIIREFDTEPTMLAWIADNQNDIELIQFEGADQWIELHPDTTSKKEPVAPFFEWALALEKSWDAPLPPKRPPKIGNSAAERQQ